MTPDQISDERQRRYNAVVVRLHKPNPELMMLRVRPDFPIPQHQAGQYCSLGLGNWEPRFPGSQDENLRPEDEAKLVRRAYSISHPILDDAGRLVARDEQDWLEFYIVLVKSAPPGQRPPGLTPRLFMLRQGDRLNIGDKITGHFTLEGVKPDDSILFLSTGTGEAPHNYMLWELLHRKHPGKIISACCVRYSRDLGYLETHRKIADHFANYMYIPLTTREARDGGRKLYIQDLIEGGLIEQTLGKPLDPASTHVYLCGNPLMIGVPTVNRETGERVYPQPRGVIEILEGRGFRISDPKAKIRGNIHFEEYW
jgi:ferredoxin--NADP+ reductase